MRMQPRQGPAGPMLAGALPRLALAAALAGALWLVLLWALA